MSDWLSVQVNTCESTGETEIIYSHTPEEFVEEMHRRKERWYVAKGVCCSCFYTPDCPITQNAFRRMECEVTKYHRTLGCVCVNAAHFRHELTKPGEVTCYGYYYQHWHDNKYLLAAKEADLITFYDVATLPHPRTLSVIVHPWLDDSTF